MNLADNLKKIRKDNNMSQEDLADALGVSRQSVSKWESGAAYPEMDKMLQLCKMFNLNIDELLNQDIKEVKETKQNKNNVNKFVDDFLDYITKTIDLFSNMSFKAKIKCIFEQAVILLVIVVVIATFGMFFIELIRSIFRYFPENLYHFFINLIQNIYVIAAFILGAILLLHIFKTRYLDYYVIVDKEEENKDNDDKTEEKAQKPKHQFQESKREKIIIRDPQNSGYKLISGLLKIMLFIIKSFVAFIALAFCFSLVLLGASFIMSFIFLKTGLTFVALITIILSLIILNLIVLNVLYNFIISKKTSKKKLSIIFASSLLTLGIGIGLFISDLVNYEIITDIKNEAYVTSTKMVPMEDISYIHNYTWYYDIEYVESTNTDLKIEIRHSVVKNFEIEQYSDGGIMIYGYGNPETLKVIIADVKDKRLIDYGIESIKIYTTKENIETLKTNYAKAFYYSSEE